jgi:hypothetical protein
MIYFLNLYILACGKFTASWGFGGIATDSIGKTSNKIAKQFCVALREVFPFEQCKTSRKFYEAVSGLNLLLIFLNF